MTAAAAAAVLTDMAGAKRESWLDGKWRGMFLVEEDGSPVPTDDLKFSESCLTNLSKGSFGASRPVLFWYLRIISRRATVPGQ